MGKYYVELGGVYEVEHIPGTANDPPQIPMAVGWLDATYLSIGGNGTLNELRAISNKHAEDFDANLTRGQWIQVKTGYGSASGSNNCVFDGVVVNMHMTIGGSEENTELVAYDHGSFLIQRMTVHGQWRRSYEREQEYFLTATETTLDPGDIILIDQPTIFNPDGQPNMTTDQYVYTGESHEDSPPMFSIFEIPFRDQVNAIGTPLISAYWTLKDAILYLLNTSNASWCIDPLSFTEAKLNLALTNGNPVISNINVEGKTMAQALTEILTPHNYCYWVDPALNSNNLHNINFFAKGKGPQLELLLSARGTNANDSDATMIHCDLLFDNGGTINRIQSFGDRLSFTTLAETNPPSVHPPLPTLYPCWGPSDLVFPPPDAGGNQPNWWNSTFRQNYCNPQLLTIISNHHGSGSMGSSSNSAAVFGVGRMWVINLGLDSWDQLEDLTMDLTVSGSGSNDGFPWDYSGSGSIDCTVTGFNSFDMRRFEKPDLFVVNSEGGLLSQQEVVVEMSTNSGASWEIVDRSEYKILPDTPGIVFINPSLDLLGIDITALDGSGSGSGSGSGFGKNYWQALFDDTLQLRILASLKSDERLHCSITNDGSAFPLAIGGIFNNTGYKRSIYNDAIDDAVYYINYPPVRSEQDDTAALAELTQTQMLNTNRTQISGAARVLMTEYGAYAVGDCITGIANRDIDFSTGSDLGPTVIHVTYKFQEQVMELTLDNHRVATIVRAKALNPAQNYNQHRLGVENPVTQGGHNVPYLPETNSDGNNKSYDRYLENGGL